MTPRNRHWLETARKQCGRTSHGLAPRTIDLLPETDRTTSKTSGKNGTPGNSAGGRKGKPALLKVGDYREGLVFVVAKVERRTSECHPEVVH